MRCKVGDLAIITHSDLTENLGKLVDVVAASKVEDEDWIVKPLRGPIPGFCKRTRKIIYGEMTYIKDSYLRPIRPDPIDEDTKIDERIPEYINK